jgi:hypothetical protein
LILSPRGYFPGALAGRIPQESPLLHILNLRFKNGKNIIHYFNRAYSPLFPQRERGAFHGQNSKGIKTFITGAQG